MSNLRDHAIRELKASGWSGSDGFYGDLMEQSVLEIVDVFSDQGHSGMSAGVCVALLEKILRFEPVVPLTGEDDEWRDMGGLQQNIRCSRVFKDEDGRTYDVRGRVFEDPDGNRWTGAGSSVDVTFPYMPTTEIVKVDK